MQANVEGGQGNAGEHAPPAAALPGDGAEGFRLAALVTALVTALALVYLFREVLFFGAVPSERDLSAFYWPAKSLLAPLFKASSGLPLWNPFLAAGQPFAANPEHEVYHPLSLLFLLVRFDWAFRLQVLLPVALAPAAMLFLARSLSLSPTTAAFCALAWGLGGYFLSTANLLPFLFSVSVLPAAMGFAARLGKGGGARDTAGLALSFGLTVLAGEPSTLLQSGILIPAAALHGALISRGTAPFVRPGRAAGLLAAGFALGCCVGAVLLLPGFGHAAKTVRATGLAGSVAGDWSLPPIRLAETVVPELCGKWEPAGLRVREALYPTRTAPFFLTIYPGLLVTAFAVAGFTLGGATGWLWLGIGLLGAGLGVGPSLPVWTLASKLPLVSGIRYPEKYVLLAALGLVVAAGIGLDAVRSGGARHRRMAWALGAAALVFLGLHIASRGGLASSSLLPADLLAPRLLRQSLVAACGAAVVVLLWRGDGHRGVALLPAVLTAVDLASAGRALVPSESVAALATPPSALRPLLLGSFEGALFHHAAYHPVLHGIPGVAGPPATAQWRIRTALDRDYDLTELAWSTRATSTISRLISDDPTMAGPVFARRGIAAVLRLRPGSAASKEEAARRPLGELLELSGVVGARPLVFCADEVVRVRGDEGWMAAVTALGPAASGAVCVDEDEPGAAALPPAPSPGRVQIVSWKPNQLTLEFHGDGPGASVLAVNQTWDRGWLAFVDGTPVPYLRVDLSLGALAVPKGRHQVTLTYRDRAVTAGAVVSVASLLVAGALLGAGRRA